MKFEVQISGANKNKKQTRVVELERTGDTWKIKLDSEPVDADVSEIAENIFSILIAGKSYELRVTALSGGVLTVQSGLEEFAAEVTDPRAWRGRSHAAEAEGLQQIVAPMPGKVIRVLVQAGEKVETGQGLLVVEAMKMQNEIRSPKTGTVERLLAEEGQPVVAGDVLCIIA
ncbi:MAG TPA: biotin/lipoyl-containing protein [Candidatus Acidoferrum sp.]|jgi:biotin carboxyl carrier protein